MRTIHQLTITVISACFVFAATFPAGAQQFTEVDPHVSKPPQPCVVWGDYDGDGDLDMLVAGLGSHDIPFTTIYKNTGGTFTDSGIVLMGLSRATAAWGDFDGDGDLDLAITGLNVSGIPTTKIYRNDGGTFTAIAGNFTGVFAGTVTWADYDGDGDLDLLVTGTATAGATATPVTRLYRNDGGAFTSVAHPFPNCYLGAVAWGDYNNDGKPDVVITGISDTGALIAAIWRNDGGTFTDIGANLPGMDLGFVAWGDYDSDGDLDLVFGGNSNDGFITRLYRNDGGTFTDANAGLLALLWSSGAWGDYDNDGDLDLMIAGYDPVAQVHRSILYRNDGGIFVDSGATFHNVFLGTVSWADYDNDGDLDLLVAGNENGSDIVSIYRNNNMTPNTIPNAPADLAANVLGASVDLSWSAGSDVQTPSAALTYNLRVGTTPGGSNIVAAQSSSAGYRRLPTMGNMQLRLGAHLRGLVPGTLYYWSVQSVDTAFAGSAFATEGSFTAFPDTPTLTQVVSRKLHGGVPFDINLLVTGNPGIECRTGGGTNDYTMVMTFSANVTVTGNPQAQVTQGTGCVGSGGACNGNVSVSGNTVTIPLTTIANAQTINVQLNGVNNAMLDTPATDFIIPMSILIGDTNANGTVNAADVAQTKARLGQTIDAMSFRSDVNTNGSINAADTAIVKQNSGTSLPP